MNEVADASGHDVVGAAEARDAADTTSEDVLDPDDGARAGDDDASDSAGTVDGDLQALTAALEGADDLSVDERLVLLRRAQETIAGSLEGLDGL